MVKKMVACTSSMLKNWKERMAQSDSNGKEIDVHKEFRALTTDIISHTAFDSNYNEGKEVLNCIENCKKWVLKLNNLSSSWEASNYTQEEIQWLKVTTV